MPITCARARSSASMCKIAGLHTYKIQSSWLSSSLHIMLEDPHHCRNWIFCSDLKRSIARTLLCHTNLIFKHFLVIFRKYANWSIQHFSKCSRAELSRRAPIFGSNCRGLDSNYIESAHRASEKQRSKTVGNCLTICFQQIPFSTAPLY